MLLNCGVGEDSWESLGLQGDPTCPSWRRAVLSVLWKDWCWSWNSNTLAIWCKELTHWKRPWCWERLKAGGEGNDRGWDGWMASLTQWIWVWVNSRSWWWTGKPGVLQSMGCKESDKTEQLNWTEPHAESLQSCLTLVIRTVAHQAPLSMGFSRQKYRVGCHAFLQGIFLTQSVIKPAFLMSLALALTGRFFTTSTNWEAHCHTWVYFWLLESLAHLWKLLL